MEENTTPKTLELRDLQVQTIVRVSRIFKYNIDIDSLNDAEIAAVAREMQEAELQYIFGATPAMEVEYALSLVINFVSYVDNTMEMEVAA